MFRTSRILCIVPSRSGSVSIPKKNLCKVGKHSLVGRSILHAQASEYIDKIVVSTNGADIKEEALKYGASVVDRPDEISGPTSSTEEAVIHAINAVNKPDYSFDYVVILQPTSPFRIGGTIDRCIERIVNENADSLVSSFRFHNFCFYKLVEDGIWHSTFDYHNRPMRQQIPLEGWYSFDCGNIYVTKVSYFLEHKCRLGGKILVEPISQLEMMQIDEPKDLEICNNIACGEIK